MKSSLPAPLEDRPSLVQRSEVRRIEGVATPLVIHFANEEVVVGTWACLLISVWRGGQRPAYARARGDAGEILAKASPGPLALFTLVLDTATLPDDPTREALARARLAPCFHRVVACAGVTEGGPLRSAALRGVSIDLDQRAPPPFPTRMFGTRAEASLWILELLGRAGERSVRGREMLAAIAEAALTR